MNRRSLPKHNPHHTPPAQKKDSTPLPPRTLLQRAVGQGLRALRPADILQLQKTMGNAAVAQLAQGPINAHSSIAPIQRIETKDAEQVVLHQFGGDGAAAAWNVLVQWLATYKLKVSQISAEEFLSYVGQINDNLNFLFPKWMKEKNLTPQHAKGKGDLFLKFLVELSKADPGTNEYLKWIVSRVIFNFTPDGDDDDYEPDIEEDDEDILEDDEEGIVVETPEELRLIEETGQRSEEWAKGKASEIEKVKTSDVKTFEPEALSSLLKKNPHLKVESENRQFKKKGSSEFTMRPKNTGDAKIVLETFTDPYTKQDTSRTVLMESEVVPMTTTGRPSAPESVSGLRTGTSAKGFTRKGASATDAYNNQGFVDAQKGHIIALELGGPDLPKNIVPQWANWQGNGYWRKMETHILATAKEVSSKSKKAHSVQMRVYIEYKAVASDTLASFRSLAFPARFKVEVWEIDSKTKEPVSGVRYMKVLEAGQDHTDDKMMYRQDHALMVDAGQESPYDKDILSKRKAPSTPRKPRATTPRKPRATKSKTPRNSKIALKSPIDSGTNKRSKRKQTDDDTATVVKKIKKKQTSNTSRRKTIY